ncbi:metal ABC transporter ATP-binding protein [Streptococcus entericus]|uniref:metal ABC transporter ATP-binding protein n=1 Tax=Streptococcus entericus TaxID=155680 RepID=UPI00037EE59D|nr:metal ABC transporter ATP-binding protein [Streptococcus entericus]
MIIIENLTVTYDGDQLVLDGLTCQIDQPGIIGIIGPNGAGKSTLMKAILGFVPFQGNVAIDGQTGVAAREKIAYVEQKSHIDVTFPMTVRECVSLGFYKKLGLFNNLTTSHWKKIDDVLSQVGLTELSKRPISALSGGQFQRMLIARCLVQEADFILLDEPFVGIDSVSEAIIIELLKELKNAGKTILVVHHDLSKVKQYFDHLLILNKKLVAYGKVSDVYTPANLQAAYGDLFFSHEEVSHA